MYMYGTLVSVIDREIVRAVHTVRSPLVNMMRNSAFAKNEQAGTDLSGSWDQTTLLKNDLDAYQDSSKVHSFIDLLQSKGSHVVDCNGNVLLDLCSTEMIPLGHNAEVFTQVSNHILFGLC